ncbi:heavy metal sensor histidine kinase [Cupriavidus sp. Agwp_2]|uniref:heavy metal sensor histidine kinase n=1 Tax=Cupriavidus sp. Agwp_2 TaxID=2897324 RepID=UPI00345F289B
MPRSLPGRLALLFAILVTVALTSVGAYSYYSLQAQLESRDEEIIRGKLAQVDHLMREVDVANGIPDSTHRLDDLVRGYDGLAIRIRTGTGQLLYRTSDAFPQNFDLDASRVALGIDTPLLTGRRTTVLGSHGTGAIVTIAQSGTERAQVIRSFKYRLLIGTTVSVILTAMLGAIITRRELLPAQQLVQQVHRINVEQLSYRVDAPTRPAEVRQIANAFNEMLQRLESGYERLYRFSADLAHDMRTPMNNLIGHAEVVLSKERNAAEYAAVLEESLLEYQRLSRMIDSMLFLARAEGANVRLEMTVIDLEEVLSKVADYFSILAEERGITISVTAKGHVLADPMLFRRAVNNVLDNAIRHADAGSTVAIRSATVGAEVIVQVSNRGEPIPEEDLEHIFERFYRGDRARSNGYRSTGLGLAIVRSIVELHGGAVQAVNIEGRVTRFELRFRGAGL